MQQMGPLQVALRESPRVCLIGDVNPPAGGVATYCRHLTAGLAKLGWEVTLVDTNGRPGKTPPEGTSRYVTTSPRRSVQRGILSGTILRGAQGPSRGPQSQREPPLTWEDRVKLAGLAAFIGSVLQEDKPAIVHTNHAGLRSLAAVRAAGRAGIPCVVTVHGSEFTSPRLERYRPVGRYVCQQCSAVIAVSRHTAAMAAATGVEAPVHVVYNGIDVAAVTSVQVTSGFLKRYELDLHRPVILYVGWLIEQKGPQVLLRAIARLPRPILDAVQVLLVGPDHGLAAALRETIREHRWSGVRLIGEVPPDDVSQFYRAATLLVFPTIKYEGFGLVAVEAAAAGCAILGSRVGAIPEVVADGVNGALFEPNRDDQLGALLERALSTPDLLQRWRDASPRVAGLFERRRMAAETARVYEDLVGSGARV